VAVGTSALREAKNAQAFLGRIRDEIGFIVRTISGIEEAGLILKGLLQDPQAHQGVVGFIDIGGGSTEIGICQEGKVVFLESLDLGAARLNQLFLSEGSTEAGAPAVRKHIRELVAGYASLSAVPPVRRALGSSGTVRAILNLLEASGRGSPIRMQFLRDLNETLVKLTPSELLEVPGMNPNRIDIIVSGSLILEEVMSFLKLEAVEYTDYALRDGILVELLEKKVKNAA
jgi:exopolyphosphatase/guanosine-5'-triphosphate,3'-diphosphate pyrophosphatase